MKLQYILNLYKLKLVLRMKSPPHTPYISMKRKLITQIMIKKGYAVDCTDLHAKYNVCRICHVINKHVCSYQLEIS